jgi:hypothetical protein
MGFMGLPNVDLFLREAQTILTKDRRLFPSFVETLGKEVSCERRADLLFKLARRVTEPVLRLDLLDYALASACCGDELRTVLLGEWADQLAQFIEAGRGSVARRKIEIALLFADPMGPIYQTARQLMTFMNTPVAERSDRPFFRGTAFPPCCAGVCRAS